MHSSFDSLGLAPALMRAVAEQGYDTPTPIQAKAIPAVLAGRDVLAGAQTGTGKTAAFTLPLLHRLAAVANTSTSPARHPVRALVLTPTRELAAQVHESVTVYGRHLPVRSTVVYGGVGINPQMDVLRRGVDILVATPGRLLDLATQKSVDLSRVEILVLDEADRMLDMGFIRDIRRVLALLPAKRQNLLFSATFSAEIRRLADGLLHDPATIEVARRNADAELVSQSVHEVAQERKRPALAHLIQAGAWSQVLVFTRTKHGANRLAEQLGRDGIAATAIHGNKSQPQRLRALAEFKQGAVRVLVATDIAARGLDIEALPHVVNFDLPHVPEDYVHRIGRTGRAGMSGEAISLVSPDQRSELAAIEKLIGRRIDRKPLPDGQALGASAKPIPERQAPAAQASARQRPAAREREAVHGNGPRNAARTSPDRRGHQHRQEAAQQRPAESPRTRPDAPQRTESVRHAAADAWRRPARRPVGALLGGMPATAEER